MDWALHGANILILCSFLVRDILALRLLSIGAGVLFCTYFYPRGMTDAIIWNVLFSIVNVVQIGRMWMQRRKIPLTDEERFLYEEFFPSLHAFDIRALCKEAKVFHIQNKECITVSGVGVIINGVLRLEDQVIPKGAFVGVRGFLERKEISVQGIGEQEVSCIQWPMQSLRTWAEQDPNRNNLLLRALSNDLLSKVSNAHANKTFSQ